jgi:hypothetical protein
VDRLASFVAVDATPPRIARQPWGLGLGKRHGTTPLFKDVVRRRVFPFDESNMIYAAEVCIAL